MNLAPNVGIGQERDLQGSARDEVLVRLRRFIQRQGVALNSRLPPERRLAAEIGTTRARLRKALAVLETEGLIWRHVGRGTFVGARPVENISDIQFLSGRTSPGEVMEARLSIEPELARMAALNATAADIGEMRRCAGKSRAAREWRVYEAWDNRLHRAIAVSTRNTLLVSLFDTLNTVRRATVWGQMRTEKLPPADHHSFAQHDALIAAIAGRDAEGAAACMRGHLRCVRDRLMTSYERSG
jgi:DNA-binding FadR family transcriptional regulator